MSDEPLKEVSPEQHYQMRSVSSKQAVSNAATGPESSYTKTAVRMAVVVACLVLGFLAGMQYEKGVPITTRPTAATGAGNFTGGRSGRYGMHRGGGLGQVSAVSGSSITIHNQRTGDAQTFKISSTTAIMDNGAAANVGDIKTGDTVMVRSAANDQGTAGSIIINPDLSGGMMNGGGLSPGPGPSDAGGTGTDDGSTI